MKKKQQTNSTLSEDSDHYRNQPCQIRSLTLRSMTSYGQWFLCFFVKCYVLTGLVMSRMLGCWFCHDVVTYHLFVLISIYLSYLVHLM